MSVIKFPGDPDVVEELNDELNAFANERFLEKIEELLDGDKDWMRLFIEDVLDAYSLHLCGGGRLCPLCGEGAPVAESVARAAQRA
jgi:hypothetical protein